ncbi:MAG: ATP-binding cassette domain-containing protein [Lachnospiraceae bacterium]|nr:ATP-binding cassette domain-containing protein [Lachnospiraceae bacterium]
MKITIISKKNSGKTLLKNISLEFERTGLVFVVGKSGAGKTTLLNIIAGNDVNYDGSIYLDNRPQRIDADYRKRIGLVNQDFNLIGALTVRENIFLGAQIAGKDATSEEYDSIVSKLDIQHLSSRKIDYLSGGEKQRVAIARALLRGNQIILADEPTGNLDQSNAEAIYECFRELASERLIIVVSHDSDAASKYADRILKICDGEVVDETINHNMRRNVEIQSEKEDGKTQRWKTPYIISGLRSRRKQMQGMAIAILSAMLLLFGILGLYSGINHMRYRVDKDLLENDKSAITQLTSMDVQEHNAIDVDILPVIKSDKTIEYAFSFFQTTIILTSNDKRLSMEYEVIEDNDFYRKRFSNIKGRLPTSYSEVVLDEQLAMFLFGTTECIDSQIECRYLEKQYSVNIVGVKKSYNTSDGTGCLFITSELANLFYQEECHLFANLSAGRGKPDSGIVSTGIGAYSPLDTAIIQGKSPQNDKEIIVSCDLVNIILMNLLNKNKLFSEEEIAAGYANEIFTGQYYLLLHTYDRVSEAKIVGISDSRKSGIFYGSWYDEAPNHGNVIIAYSTLTDAETINHLDILAEQNSCIASRRSGLIVSIISGQISMFIAILGIIALLFTVICIFTIKGFMKFSMSKRLYEIGVLLSLGNRKKDIMGLLLGEQGIMAVLIVSISSITWIIAGKIILEKNIFYNGISIFFVDWWHFVVVDVFLILLILLCSLGEILKISKMSITDAIASRYS